MSQTPQTLLLPRAGGSARVDRSRHVVVVGGGIAGVAAATVLAERGVQVTLIEREAFLGGRAGAWTEHLGDGTPFEMERGFHAFFRQYYNLQRLLRRIDPQLGFLQPLSDYPILGPQGKVQSFAGLPRRTPQNVISLTLRTPTLGLRDLLHVDKRQALEMLRFDMQRSYSRWDRLTAAQYLDSLQFPADARRLLFDVFSHSFFNPEDDMSAAELLMMFHFYFTGNPEGLIFDVARRPFSTALWQPFERYLQSVGVSLRLQHSVSAVQRYEHGWRVLLDRGHPLVADGVVLATTVPGLQRIVAASPDLDEPAWRRSVADLQLTHPFVVWRLWLNGPTRAERAPFVGTTGLGLLDNISLYHLFEDESREWATRTGGSVVELHAYAVPPETHQTDIRADLLQALHALYPETASLDVLEERYLLRQDCPAFAPGSMASRPTVDTPLQGIVLAGDFVKLPIPSALMERATASGFLAANQLLARDGVQPEPILSVPPRGLLSRLPVGGRSPQVQEVEA
jgi:isorenieratene synthase